MKSLAMRKISGKKVWFPHILWSHPWSQAALCRKLVSVFLCILFLGFSAVFFLHAQSLQDDSLSYLYGETVMPQDSELGLMYLPSGGEREEVFRSVRNFWNEVNSGAVSDKLLSRTGRKQVVEQLAPFLRKTPELYRESLQNPEDRVSDGMRQESPEEKTGQKGDAEAKPSLPPLRSLQLVKVRVANPVIERDYARVRCRLEVERGEAFLFVQVFLAKESNLWLVDVLDIDWDNIVDKQSEPPMQVFGRKQGLYEQ